MPESLTPELVALRDRVQSLIDDDLRPLEAALGDDLEAAVPEETRARVRERSRELGLFAMTQPRAFGGNEAGPLALTVVRETLAAANLRLARYVFGPGPGVLGAATGELRARYLEPLMRGEKSGAWAFTEPSDGSRPTWAKRDGDELVITGRKAYVTGGARADFYSVLVNVEEDAAGPGGTAMVVVDRATPGLTIERSFHSLEGGNHVELRLDGARAPLTHVVGKIGEGMPRALGNISQMRLGVAAQASGLAMWVTDFVDVHIAQPHRSGVRLGDREGVRLHYADIRIGTYAARAMLYRTARLVDGAKREDEVMNEVMATKVYCTEHVGRAVDTAIQLVGGQALIAGHPLERLYRQVRSMRIAEGASDLLRLNIARGRIEFHSGRV
ncbi:MAG: acyl-CoA dehydrogenase [Chloroflexi bacterium]|nr:acyl-CoA dehydrogenase [Chloroflexota bacterium]